MKTGRNIFLILNSARNYKYEINLDGKWIENEEEMLSQGIIKEIPPNFEERLHRFFRWDCESGRPLRVSLLLYSFQRSIGAPFCISTPLLSITFWEVI